MGDKGGKKDKKKNEQQLATKQKQQEPDAFTGRSAGTRCTRR